MRATRHTHAVIVLGSQNVEQVQLWDSNAKHLVVSAPVDMLHATPDALGFVCVNLHTARASTSHQVPFSSPAVGLQSRPGDVVKACGLDVVRDRGRGGVIMRESACVTLPTEKLCIECTSVSVIAAMYCGRWRDICHV